MGAMTTYVRAGEAARLLGVTPATLYAYVSRGRIARTRSIDGRTSLFTLDAIEALRHSSRRSDTSPRPTIDVQITSAVTHLGDDGIEFRGRSLTALVHDRRFEDVAELLWTDRLPEKHTVWTAPVRRDIRAVTATLDTTQVGPIARLAIAAAVLGGHHGDDDAIAAARRLLSVAPSALGPARVSGTFALRLATAWRPRPPVPVVDAIDRALSLLADHELATSTLAVRIAASVRAPAYAAFVAGLATVEGALHGSAASHVHHLLDECARRGVDEVIDAERSARRRIPGFGHKIYRQADPRLRPLLDAVRAIAPRDPRFAVVDDVLGQVARTVPTQPNVDFALGALTWIAGLPDDAPIFAVARIAGWAAHYVEELDEPPVRFRGLARRPT